jgi:hypothetical protein
VSAKTRKLEAPTLALISAYALLGTFVLPELLLQDGWLALVAGREIAAHGLPHTDELAILTKGEPWIDQQWLAQLTYYGLAALGGLKAVLLGHLLVLGATFVGILRAARAQGASAAAAALTAVPTLFIAPWALQLRPQTLALPLFVALLALLLADARRPSRQVFLVLPLLVLWANVHGTVLLGAAIVALYAATRLLQRPRMHLGRAGLLVAGAVVAVLVTPYGFEIVGYYQQMLLNPLLPEFVSEWRPTKLSLFTIPFYALAGLTLYLLGRVGRTLTRFEQLTLLALLANALFAIRSITWFGLAALIILPRALDAAAGNHVQKQLPVIGSHGRRIALAAAAAACVAIVVAAARPAGWAERPWPVDALPVLAAQITPATTVLADDRYADWLLWHEPRLRGRIAYDIRFELLDRRQLDQVTAYRKATASDWRKPVGSYDLHLVEPTDTPALARALGRTGDTVYTDPSLIIIRQAAE